MDHPGRSGSAMTFSYEFTLGQAEQVRASRIVVNRRTSTRVSYIALVVAMLLMGIWGHRATRGRGSAVILPTVLAGAAGGTAAIYMSPYWAVRGLRRKNRAAGSTHKYELASSGLSATAVGASSTEFAPAPRARHDPGSDGAEGARSASSSRSDFTGAGRR